MSTVTLDAKKLANQVTLHIVIRHERQWTIRLRIAVWLIRLATWIAWMDVKFHGMEPQ